MDSAAAAVRRGSTPRPRTMADTAEVTAGSDPYSAALAYAAHGWRVIPIGPNSKHPKVPAWQNAATTNAEIIANWYTGMYRDNGVGIATGQASGVWVLDVDVAAGKHGDETLEDLQRRYGPLPETVEVQTGSGGRHLYFRHPEGVEIRNNAATRLGAGLDVRGDGGQVLAPPTIHPTTGRPYVWVIGQGWDEMEVADAPRWLLELVSEPVARIETPTRTRRDPFAHLGVTSDLPGDRWAAVTTWRQVLEPDGWTLHHVDAEGIEYWTRPGKDVRDGVSATVGYGGTDLLKVFTSSVAGLEQEKTYSKLGYVTCTRFGGDYSAAARWCGEQVRPPSAPAAADITPEPVAELEPHEFESVAMRGGDALLSVEEAPPARWGHGDQVLWACGESLLIAGRTGTGKTTLGIGVLAGLVGLEGACLGLPILAANRVLYLGMDRPRQILRALSRRFGPETFAVLNERLVFRKGPLPKDLAKDPSLLLTLAQQYGCDVVIVDSLKDAAVKLVDEEVGGQINRAIQLCNANDVDVMVLHHQRKGNVADRKNEDDTPTVEDVFGSSWITAGAGSILIIQGQPGDNVVRLHHVKQPAEPLGPWTLEHDHHAGRTEIQAGSFDLLAYLRSCGPLGTTSVAAAKAELGKDVKSGSPQDAKAKRGLERLVRAGLAEKVPGMGRTTGGQKTPDRWVKTLDGCLDGLVDKAPLTAPSRPLTGEAFAQVEPLMPSLTALDAQGLVGSGGVFIPPDDKAPPSDPVDISPQAVLEEWGL